MTTVVEPTTSQTPTLSARLDALAKLVELGAERLDPTLLDQARTLLARAGDRLRLSGEHTVVALAGGTGSGKSTLFNAITGLDLSIVGVRRPTTSYTHACVWGMAGSQGLLDWLGVDKRYRYARVTTLERDDFRLRGLLLLDLPDHDSIRAAPGDHADRIIRAADLLVWVLDPQKYADAAVHRYLAELAGHGAVTVFVLNQSDLLRPSEVAECVTDLRALLKKEGFDEPRVIVTSAATGAGLEELTGVLREAVAERNAATERLAADLDRLVGELSGAADPATQQAADPVEAVFVAALVDALTDAAGVPAVGEAVDQAYRLRAAKWLDWLPARWLPKLRRDPLRRMRLAGLRDEIDSTLTGPVSVQPAEVDNAVQLLVERVNRALPAPWASKLRATARKWVTGLPAVLDEALADVTPQLGQVPAWWRLVKASQYLLFGIAAVALLWSGAIVAFGVLGLWQSPTAALGATGLLPWLLLGVTYPLAVGLVTSLLCHKIARKAAADERERVERRMRERVEAVAREAVLAPLATELAEYEQFRAALEASG